MTLRELESFKLAGDRDAHYFGVANRPNLDANGFNPEVRKFHIDRLPKLTVNFTGSLCAYCGKLKDRRSMQIDHIIPVRVYCRYKLLDEYTKYNILPTPLDLQRYYNDQDNLILACQRCNGKKGETMPDRRVRFRDHLPPETPITRALQVFSQHAPILAKIRKIENECRSIGSLGSEQNKFVLKGANWNTSKIKTRYRRGAGIYSSDSSGSGSSSDSSDSEDRFRGYGAGAGRGSGYSSDEDRKLGQSSSRRRPRPSRDKYRSRSMDALHKKRHYGRKSDTGNAMMGDIHRLVVSAFSTGRTNIGIGPGALESSQAPPTATAAASTSASSGTTKNLRLCFYCLGLFQKQAFQLDHINPIGRPIYGGFPNTLASKIAYNNPANILAVCRSCNTSKQQKSLSRVMLDQYVEKRQQEGLPGIESNPRIDLEDAKRIRNQLLGL